MMVFGRKENIKRPLTLASSAYMLQGSSTAVEPPLGSPSGPPPSTHPHKPQQCKTCHGFAWRVHVSSHLFPEHKNSLSSAFI